MAVFQVILLAFAMIRWNCAQSIKIQIQPNTEDNSLNMNCSFEKPSPGVIAVLTIQIVRPTSQGEEGQGQSSKDEMKPFELEEALATIQFGKTNPTLKDDSGTGRLSVEGYINSSDPLASFLKMNIRNISASDAGPYQCIARFLDSSFTTRIEWAETNITVPANTPQDVLSVAQIAELQDRLKAVEQNETMLKEKVDKLVSNYNELLKSVGSLLNQTSSLDQTVHDASTAIESYKSLVQQLIRGKNDKNTPGQTAAETPPEQKQVPPEQEQVKSEVFKAPSQEKEASSHTQVDKFIPDQNVGVITNLTNSSVIVPSGANEGKPATATRKCFVCGDPEANLPCNGEDLAAGSPIECPEGQNFCMNEINQTMDSSSIYKRCASETECYQKDNSKSPSCQEFFAILFDTSARSCTFCCNKDGCNNDFKPSSGLLHNEAPTMPPAAH